MEEDDVFRVFIPGETTNRDYRQNVIGSFGMGAKKGIFRLTDGAKVISCPNGDISYTELYSRVDGAAKSTRQTRLPCCNVRLSVMASSSFAYITNGDENDFSLIGRLSP